VWFVFAKTALASSFDVFVCVQWLYV